MMKINEKDIRSLVDEPYFSRGREYLAARSVKITTVTERSVKGKIMGSSAYSVKLSHGKSGLDGTCTCPAFDNFGPCKHLAALGLAIVAYHKGEFKGLKSDFKEYVDEAEDFERALKRKSKSELIDMIVRMSDLYPDMRYEFME